MRKDDQDEKWKDEEWSSRTLPIGQDVIEGHHRFINWFNKYQKDDWPGILEMSDMPENWLEPVMNGVVPVSAMWDHPKWSECFTFTLTLS